MSSPAPYPRFIVALFAALVGFLVGLAIFFGPFPTFELRWPEFPGLTPSAYPYVNRRFMIWLFIVCSQIGLWCVAGVAVGPRALRGFAMASARVRIEVLAAAFVLLVLLVLPRVVTQTFIGSISSIDTFLYPRILVVSVLGFFAALPSIAGMWLLLSDATTIPRLGPRREDEITRLVQMRHDLQRYLGILGAIVAAAVVSDNGLRGYQNAVLSEILARCDALSKDMCALGTTALEGFYALSSAPPTNIKPDDPRLIPPESTIIYGLFFTLLLALAYVPVYQRLSDAAQRILTNYRALPDPTDPAWTTVYQGRKGLEEYIGLQAGPFENVRASIAILAPFIGGVLGVALPGAH